MLNEEINNLVSGLRSNNSLAAFKAMEEKVAALEAEAEASSVVSLRLSLSGWARLAASHSYLLQMCCWLVMFSGCFWFWGKVYHVARSAKQSRVFVPYQNKRMVGLLGSRSRGILLGGCDTNHTIASAALLSFLPGFEGDVLSVPPLRVDAILCLVPSNLMRLKYQEKPNINASHREQVIQVSDALFQLCP